MFDQTKIIDNSGGLKKLLERSWKKITTITFNEYKGEYRKNSIYNSIIETQARNSYPSNKEEDNEIFES